MSGSPMDQQLTRFQALLRDVLHVLFVSLCVLYASYNISTASPWEMTAASSIRGLCTAGQQCLSRESNPGHIDGNDVFCH